MYDISIKGQFYYDFIASMSGFNVQMNFLNMINQFNSASVLPSDKGF